MQINESMLQARIDQILAETPTVGALVQVKFAEDKILRVASGSLRHADPETARFPIYSIAKTLLAIFAIKLSEQGKLRLDQSVTSLLQRPLPAWMQDATVLHLLAHRSGLFDYGPMKAYHEAVKKNPGQASDAEYFVSQVLEKGAQFEPDASFFYSNIGYLFVREIVESVSKMSLQELFDEMVGAPLGIKMNFLAGMTGETIAGFSPYLSGSSPDVRSLYDYSWVYHGTFLSGLSELTTLFSKLHLVLSPDSVNAMTKLHRLTFPHPEIHPSYGLGLMGDMESKFGVFYGHNGGGPGFSVSAYAAPTKNATIAAVVNRDSSVEAETLVFGILKML